jgi:hypothetical protein
MKVWESVTFEALLAAMDHYDAFSWSQLQQSFPGFKPARSVAMHRGDRGPYHSRMLLAIAVHKLYNNQIVITATDFLGTDAQVFLESKWGFEIRRAVEA